MLGLDSQVTMHCSNIRKDAKLVKQQHRCFRPELIEAIKTKVKKLIDSRTTSLLDSEYHPCTQEKQQDLDMHRLQKFKFCMS